MKLACHVQPACWVPKVISFNSVVSACEKSLQWQLALQLFNELGKRHLEAGMVHGSSFI